MSKRRNYKLYGDEPEVGDVVQIKTTLGGWSQPMLVVSKSHDKWRDGSIEVLDTNGTIFPLMPSSSIYKIHIVSKKS